MPLSATLRTDTYDLLCRGVSCVAVDLTHAQLTSPSPQRHSRDKISQALPPIFRVGQRSCNNYALGGEPAKEASLYDGQAQSSQL